MTADQRAAAYLATESLVRLTESRDGRYLVEWDEDGLRAQVFSDYASAWQAYKRIRLVLALMSLGVDALAAMGSVVADESTDASLSLWRRFLALFKRFGLNNGEDFNPPHHEPEPRALPGERNPHARLRYDEVWELLRDPGTSKEWAKRLDIAESRIRAIRNGRGWTHVPRPEVTPPWPRGRPPKS